jgi:transposase
MIFTQHWTRKKNQILATLAKYAMRIERRIREVFSPNEGIRLIESLPGVGLILSVVILSEVGDVERFLSAQHFASYSGTTPRVHASGGKVRLGPLRTDVNCHLKWAFVEASNTIALNRRH